MRVLPLCITCMSLQGSEESVRFPGTVVNRWFGGGGGGRVDSASTLAKQEGSSVQCNSVASVGPNFESLTLSSLL